MPQKNPIPISFPLGGINENSAYAAHPGPVIVRTDHVQNMRPFRVDERRESGGQRTGIDKYVADPINGSNPIQHINSVVEAFDPASVQASELLFERDFNADFPLDGALTTLDPGFWETYTDHYASRTESTNCEINIGISTGGSDRGALVLDACANAWAEAVYAGPAITIGDKYIISAHCQITALNPTGNPHPIQWRLDPLTRDGFGIRVDVFSGDLRIRPFKLTAGAVALQPVTTGTTITTGLVDTDSQLYAIEVSGNTFTCRVNGAILWTYVDSSFAGNTDIACGVYETTSGEGTVQSFKIEKGIVPASLRSTRLVVVSGGNIAVGDKTSGLAVPPGGTGAQKTSGITASSPAFQDLFFCDGIAADYKYLDLDTDQVKDWATDVTAGSLPVGTTDPSIACRIIATYRGRIALSGLSEEPENWFLAKAGDPFDWDFSPAVTNQTQAVAGNSSDVGVMGDIVTSLMPYQDDLLFMGGDHTLWVMRGDPASGGEIDNISRQIGVVGQFAWTWDTGSTLYFLGQNGLYALAPGSGTPNLISSRKMDRIFSEIDFATNNVFLVYDREWQGVHIFLSPVDQPATAGDHYWWDKRTDSWWRDRYPLLIGPTFVHLFDADLQDDRAVLIGGYDSFLRAFDENTNNDDGEAIDSFVRFPLVHTGIPQGQFQMDDLQIHTDSGGSSVQLDIYRGKTPQETALSTASIFNKTLVAGRNLPIRKRFRANALQYQLRNNTLGETWGYENGMVLVSGVGRQRARL